MTSDGLTPTAWRKSSYSGSNGGNCVEIGLGIPDTVPVRDSKNPTGPILTFPRNSWHDFLTALKNGEITHP